jgi:hypothetical protein
MPVLVVYCKLGLLPHCFNARHYKVIISWLNCSGCGIQTKRMKRDSLNNLTNGQTFQIQETGDLITGQAVCMFERNIETPSCIHCRRKLHIPSHCVCLFSLNCLTRNAHAPYYHLWPVWLYHILPHCLIKLHDFRKKFEHKMCSDFIYKICLKHF